MIVGSGKWLKEMPQETKQPIHLIIFWAIVYFASMKHFFEWNIFMQHCFISKSGCLRRLWWRGQEGEVKWRQWEDSEDDGGMWVDGLNRKKEDGAVPNDCKVMEALDIVGKVNEVGWRWGKPFLDVLWNCDDVVLNVTMVFTGEDVNGNGNILLLRLLVWLLVLSWMVVV